MSDFDPDEIIEEVLAGNKDRFRLLVREYGLLVRGYLSARVYHLRMPRTGTGSVFNSIRQTFNL